MTDVDIYSLPAAKVNGTKVLCCSSNCNTQLPIMLAMAKNRKIAYLKACYVNLAVIVSIQQLGMYRKFKLGDNVTNS